ncbi:MAG: hypothetical protein V9H69_18920 [Anaerolineae bacterium]
MTPTSARWSPGCTLEERTSRAGATSPSMTPETMGRSNPTVISVWPPTSVTPNAAQAAAICS